MGTTGAEGISGKKQRGSSTGGETAGRKKENKKSFFRRKTIGRRKRHQKSRFVEEARIDIRKRTEKYWGMGEA